MKYCTKCGKALFDEAVICPKCGCPTQLYQQPPVKAKPVRPPVEKKPRKKMSKKAKLILIISLAVAIIAGIIATILFMPRNVELDAFTKPQTKLNCLLSFGLPTSELDDGSWYYENTVSIKGIEVECLFVDFAKEEYRLVNSSVGTQFAISTYIKMSCNFIGSESNYFSIYHHENLVITAGGWTTVYITYKD